MEMAVTFHLRGALIVHSSLSDALTVSTAPQDVCRSDLAEGLKSPGLSLWKCRTPRPFSTSQGDLLQTQEDAQNSLQAYMVVWW